MSNFDTLTPHVAGRAGLAPVGFDACTEDDLATITTAGYLDDLAVQGNIKVKHNDYFYINYLATGLLPSTLAVFRVNEAGGVFSLVAFP